MDDFLPILFLVVYLIAVSSSSKKKKAQKAKRGNSSPRTVLSERSHRARRAFDAAFEWETPKGGSSAPQGAQPAPEKREADLFPPRAACNERPIHLHEVTQEQMAYAGEGEDPCHAGGASVHARDRADEREEESQAYHPEDAEQIGFAQDVLRGVIMSEILTRPHERRRNNGTVRRV